MPSAIESKGIISYGGLVFPTSSSVKVSAVPIYDSSRRTEKYIRYSITVDCIFAEDEFPQSLGRRSILNSEGTGRIDEAFDYVRRVLTEPGEPLVLTWSGVGDKFIVNPDDTVDFGPKPSIILIEPIATTRALHVIWQCEATCPDFLERNKIGDGPLPYGEWNYEVTFGFSSDGLTTRTISGVLESRVKKVGQKIDQSAERFLDNLDIPIDDRFRRTQTHSLSKDKRFLNYTIIDEEIPSDNPLFPNCVTMDIRHRVSTDLGVTNDYLGTGKLKLGAIGMWGVTLSGSIKVAPGVPRIFAWLAFKNVLSSRIAKAALGKTWKFDKSGGRVAGKPTIAVPVKFSMEEEVFGRTMTFSVSWRFTCNLDTILMASGLWLPVPGNWNAWKTSVGISKAHSSRGTLNISNPANIDVIVNFNEGLIGPGTSESIDKKDDDTYDNAMFACPDEDKSLFDYDGVTDIDFVGGTVAPVKVGAFVSPGEAINLSGTLGEGGMPLDGSTSGGQKEAVIQKRSIGRWILTYRGYIIRISHPLKTNDVPTVSTIGGQPAVRINGGFTLPHKAGSIIGNCPIYVTTWEHKYHVESPEGFDVVILNEPELDPLSPPSP